jgi:hypothetical protein
MRPNDTPLSFRAMVKHRFVSPVGETVTTNELFPPTQYSTVDNKYDFTRNLTDFLSNKDWITVDVQQGGKYLYSFNK